MCMSREAIGNRVSHIMQKCFQLSVNTVSSRNWNEPLTSSAFHLTAVDLVYLLFEIEKSFDIRISNAALESYGLYSVNAIIDTIGLELESVFT